MKTLTIVLNTGEQFHGTWTVGDTDPEWFSFDLDEDSLFEKLTVPKDNVRFILYEKEEAGKETSILDKALEKMNHL